MIHIANYKHFAYLLKCKAQVNEIIEICDTLQKANPDLDKTFYGEKITEKAFKPGRIKRRIINPSRGRLKQIQKKIKSKILKTISFPAYVQGANSGFSNISNASFHLGNKYKFTTDLKKFFPSITPIHIYQALMREGTTPKIARLITLLTTYKGKVPQGAPTSSHIANLVFKEIDYELNKICSEQGCVYTRYIDDITISSPKPFKQIIPQVVEIIERRGFKISPRKTHYKGLLEITGIEVSLNSMKPNKKFYESLTNETTADSLKGKLAYEQRVISKKKHFLR